MLDAAGDSQLHLYLLGRFELRVGDHVLIDRKWTRSKAKALLKLLALQRDRSMHRERVMDALWPELDAASAANNLHKNLHYLRTAVQDDRIGDIEIIASNDSILTLAPEIWIDADGFREASRLARDLRRAAAYEEALALYGGELLPEDIYESWTDVPREEARALHEQLLIEVSELYEASGGPHVAEARLYQVLEADPLHEDAHRRLIQLYARSGNRDRALRQYQKLRDALRREFGVEPSRETRAIYTEILAADPAFVDESPAVEYAVASDGVRIAYQVHRGVAQGEAGPPIVFVRGWLSHIELLWEDDRLRDYFLGIAGGRDFVMFDMRGNGRSERHVPPITVDDMVRDLEAVIDAIPLPVATLYGATYGGPAAAVYAARHPDRANALILDGSYARGAEITTPELQKRFLDALRSGPAGFMLLTHLTGKEAPRTRYRRLDHTAQMISPEVAVQLYALAFVTDISAELPNVTAPTLVMHREGSRAVPVALGRDLASRIAGARWVTLPGAEHNTWEGDAEPAIDAVTSFLDGIASTHRIRAS